VVTVSRAFPGWAAGLLFALAPWLGAGYEFVLPTPNRALLEPGGEERYFVGTVGKTWLSGTFGCVRSEGWQVHEGLDIRATQRDRRGEPTDPVMATAEGTVAYVNTRAALSNYGQYLIVRHQVDGLEVYSLYAHLGSIRQGLKPGQPVRAGEAIGTMGRTANTRQGISKDRAHLHFELNLLVNDRFAAWYKQRFPDQRNDHGDWNGQNLLALDPKRVLLGSLREGNRFNLAGMLQDQTELCRVLVRKTDFPWLRRYRALVRPNPVAEKEGVAGYELILNFNGIPFGLIPRANSEIQTQSKTRLLSVNESEYRKNPGKKLIVNKGGRWQLTNQGENLIALITY
jgi:murein DD-endopeptidase MepM/ murein hydrolase activator NlpD